MIEAVGLVAGHGWSFLPTGGRKAANSGAAALRAVADRGINQLVIELTLTLCRDIG